MQLLWHLFWLPAASVAGSPPPLLRGRRLQGLSACSAHPACAVIGLSGDCCPTLAGKDLSCCDDNSKALEVSPQQAINDASIRRTPRRWAAGAYYFNPTLRRPYTPIWVVQKPPPEDLACLRPQPSGCSILGDMASCLSSKDGRDVVSFQGAKIAGEPCVWCGGIQCTTSGPSRCEPFEYVMYGEGIAFADFTAKGVYKVAGCRQGDIALPSHYDYGCLETSSPKGCVDIWNAEECLASRDGRSVSAVGALQVQHQPCVWCGGGPCHSGAPSLCEAFDYAVNGAGRAFALFHAEDVYRLGACHKGEPKAATLTDFTDFVPGYTWKPRPAPTVPPRDQWWIPPRPSAQNVSCLTDQPTGCSALQDMGSCLSSRDGRLMATDAHGLRIHGEPCVWCGGGLCHSNSTSYCEPFDFVMRGEGKAFGLFYAPLQFSVASCGAAGVPLPQFDFTCLSNENRGCHTLRRAGACLQSRDGRPDAKIGGLRVHAEPCVWCGGVPCHSGSDALCEAYDYAVNGQGRAFVTSSSQSTFTFAGCKNGRPAAMDPDGFSPYVPGELPRAPDQPAPLVPFWVPEHPSPDEMTCLADVPGGCTSITDMAACLSSKDTSGSPNTDGLQIQGEPCVWCRNGPCTSNSSAQCQPFDYLMHGEGLAFRTFYAKSSFKVATCEAPVARPSYDYSCLKPAANGCTSITNPYECTSSTDGRPQERIHGLLVHGEPCVWCGGGLCRTGANTLCEPFDYLMNGEGRAFSLFHAKLTYSMAACNDGQPQGATVDHFQDHIPGALPTSRPYWWITQPKPEGEETSCLMDHRFGCYVVRNRETCLGSFDGRETKEWNGLKIRGEPCVWCGGFPCQSNSTNLCEPYDFLMHGEGKAFATFYAKYSYNVARCKEGRPLLPDEPEASASSQVDYVPWAPPTPQPNWWITQPKPEGAETDCLMDHRYGCHVVKHRDTCLGSKDGRETAEWNGLKIHGEPCVWCGGVPCQSNSTNLCEPYDFLLHGEGKAFSTFYAKTTYNVARCQNGVPGDPNTPEASYSDANPPGGYPGPYPGTGGTSEDGASSSPGSTTCEAHPACVRMGLRGQCCPAASGENLECCSDDTAGPGDPDSRGATPLGPAGAPSPPGGAPAGGAPAPGPGGAPAPSGGAPATGAPAPGPGGAPSPGAGFPGGLAPAPGPGATPLGPGGAPSPPGGVQAGGVPASGPGATPSPPGGVPAGAVPAPGPGGVAPLSPGGIPSPPGITPAGGVPAPGPGGVAPLSPGGIPSPPGITPAGGVPAPGPGGVLPLSPGGAPSPPGSAPAGGTPAPGGVTPLSPGGVSPPPGGTPAGGVPARGPGGVSPLGPGGAPSPPGTGPAGGAPAPGPGGVTPLGPGGTPSSPGATPAGGVPAPGPGGVPGATPTPGGASPSPGPGGAPGATPTPGGTSPSPGPGGSAGNGDEAGEGLDESLEVTEEVGAGDGKGSDTKPAEGDGQAVVTEKSATVVIPEVPSGPRGGSSGDRGGVAGAVSGEGLGTPAPLNPSMPTLPPTKAPEPVGATEDAANGQEQGGSIPAGPETGEATDHPGAGPEGTPGGTAAPGAAAGADCWYECGQAGGFCDFCGAGRACCRDGWGSNPTECTGATGYTTSANHQCVPVAPGTSLQPSPTAEPVTDATDDAGEDGDGHAGGSSEAPSSASGSSPTTGPLLPTLPPLPPLPTLAPLTPLQPPSPAPGSKEEAGTQEGGGGTGSSPSPAPAGGSTIAPAAGATTTDKVAGQEATGDTATTAGPGAVVLPGFIPLTTAAPAGEATDSVTESPPQGSPAPSQENSGSAAAPAPAGPTTPALPTGADPFGPGPDAATDGGEGTDSAEDTVDEVYELRSTTVGGFENKDISVTTSKVPDGVAKDDCWWRCGQQAGLCPEFCGTGKACCRSGVVSDPVECKGVSPLVFTTLAYHQCVQVEPEPKERDEILPTFKDDDILVPNSTQRRNETNSTVITMGGPVQSRFPVWIWVLLVCILLLCMVLLLYMFCCGGIETKHRKRSAKRDRTSREMEAEEAAESEEDSMSSGKEVQMPLVSSSQTSLSDSRGLMGSRGSSRDLASISTRPRATQQQLQRDQLQQQQLLLQQQVQQQQLLQQQQHQLQQQPNQFQQPQLQQLQMQQMQQTRQQQTHQQALQWQAAQQQGRGVMPVPMAPQATQHPGAMARGVQAGACAAAGGGDTVVAGSELGQAMGQQQGVAAAGTQMARGSVQGAALILPGMRDAQQASGQATPQATSAAPAGVGRGSSAPAGAGPDLFDLMDRNHDGIVSQSEFNQAMGAQQRAVSATATFQATAATVQTVTTAVQPATIAMQARASQAGQPDLFDLVDRNHDGVISQSEFGQALGVQPQRRVSALQAQPVATMQPPAVAVLPARPVQSVAPGPGPGLFDVIDRNHDGVISQSEFGQAMGVPRGVMRGGPR